VLLLLHISRSARLRPAGSRCVPLDTARCHSATLGASGRAPVQRTLEDAEMGCWADCELPGCARLRRAAPGCRGKDGKEHSEFDLAPRKRVGSPLRGFERAPKNGRVGRATLKVRQLSVFRRSKMLFPVVITKLPRRHKVVLHCKFQYSDTRCSIFRDKSEQRSRGTEGYQPWSRFSTTTGISKYGENDFVASTKRFVNIASAN